jgi:hypothetical protein
VPGVNLQPETVGVSRSFGQPRQFSLLLRLMLLQCSFAITARMQFHNVGSGARGGFDLLRRRIDKQ